MAKKAYLLPLKGYSVTEVRGNGRFVLRFDDPARSSLLLEAPFSFGADDSIEEYEPPCPGWVLDILESVIGVVIDSARYDRLSNLQITFVDGRELRVNDGPFENWRYSNDLGETARGGVGKVSWFTDGKRR